MEGREGCGRILVKNDQISELGLIKIVLFAPLKKKKGRLEYKLLTPGFLYSAPGISRMLKVSSGIKRYTCRAPPGLGEALGSAERPRISEKAAYEGGERDEGGGSARPIRTFFSSNIVISSENFFLCWSNFPVSSST